MTTPPIYPPTPFPGSSGSTFPGAGTPDNGMSLPLSVQQAAWGSASTGVNIAAFTEAAPVTFGMPVEFHRTATHFASISNQIKRILVAGEYGAAYYMKHTSSNNQNTIRGYGAEIFVNGARVGTDGICVSRSVTRGTENGFFLHSQIRGLNFAQDDDITFVLYASDGQAGNPALAQGPTLYFHLWFVQ